MLKDRGAAYRYREYTKQPLTEVELRAVLAQLGMTARDVLRSRDAAKAGLTGAETDDELILLMVGNPRLLQRPIGIREGRAVLGRPVENLLTLID